MSFGMRIVLFTLVFCFFRVSLRLFVTIFTQGCTCTVEMCNGDTYRGLVIDVEDCWNIQINECQYTSRSGKTSKLEHVYIRGSQIRFVIVPDMLKNSPSFIKFASTSASQSGPSAKKQAV